MGQNQNYKETAFKPSKVLGGLFPEGLFRESWTSFYCLCTKCWHTLNLWILGVVVTKWIKHTVEYAIFRTVTLEGYKVIPKRLPRSGEFASPPWRRAFTTCALFSPEMPLPSQHLSIWFLNQSNRIQTQLLWIKWLMELDDTFKKSESQNQNKGGAVRAVSAISKGNSCSEAPKDAPNPGKRGSVIYLSRKKFWCVFLPWLKPKTEQKNTVSHARDALWAPRSWDRWNVTTRPGFKPWLCNHQLGNRRHDITWVSVSSPIESAW